jgi:hypothetical protein
MPHIIIVPCGSDSEKRDGHQPQDGDNHPCPLPSIKFVHSEYRLWKLRGIWALHQLMVSEMPGANQQAMPAPARSSVCEFQNTSRRVRHILRQISFGRETRKYNLLRAAVRSLFERVHRRSWRNSIIKRDNARAIASPARIHLSLPCGAQKRQNPEDVLDFKNQQLSTAS